MAKKNGMGSHQSSRMITDIWLTPPEIVNALAPFDLDPCSPLNRPWDTAKRHFTINDNGLLQPWEGLIWCNPPYGQQTIVWMQRMAMHNNGIALIFARTETRIFFDFVWPYAKSILFLKGRLFFYKADGTKGKWNGGAPSVLIAYGDLADERLRSANIKGKYIRVN